MRDAGGAMAQTTIGMGEAAKLASVSKSTLTRAVKAGRLSAKRDETGAYRVEVSELERVYPLQAHQSVPNETVHHAPEREAVSDAPVNAALEAQIEGLKAQLDLMRDALDDAREQRDGWQRQAENAQRLLPDLNVPPRRRWFGFGKAS